MSEDWKEKWEFIIDIIGKLIAREGNKIAVINVQPQKNTKKQFKQFQIVCE